MEIKNVIPQPVERQKNVENPFAFEEECIAKLDEYLKERFPRTYSNKKNRAVELFSICAGLSEGGTFLPNEIVEICKKTLKEKTILSLGDDYGSLSEVLTSFGAECVGIEYDEKQVEIARTGASSEEGKPNMSVIQGDIWDLVIDDTELAKKLNGNKFDVIISVGLFNSGSGGTTPNTSRLEKIMPLLKEYTGNANLTHLTDSASAEYDWFPIFVLRIQKMLKDKGVQIHNRVDVADESFRFASETPPDKLTKLKDQYFPDHQFNYGQMGRDKRNLIFSGKIRWGPSSAMGFIIKK